MKSAIEYKHGRGNTVAAGARGTQHRERLQKGRAGPLLDVAKPKVRDAARDAAPARTVSRSRPPTAPQRNGCPGPCFFFSRRARPHAAAPAQLACWPACRRRPPRSRGRHRAPSRIASAASDHPCALAPASFFLQRGPACSPVLFGCCFSAARVRQPPLCTAPRTPSRIALATAACGRPSPLASASFCVFCPRTVYLTQLIIISPLHACQAKAIGSINSATSITRRIYYLSFVPPVNEAIAWSNKLSLLLVLLTMMCMCSTLQAHSAGMCDSCSTVGALFSTLPPMAPFQRMHCSDLVHLRIPAWPVHTCTHK